MTAEPQAFEVTAHTPYLERTTRLHIEQTRGKPLVDGAKVTVIPVERVAEAAEAIHEMHTALLQIAECEDLDEARSLARAASTWG